jgi:hypothetical protein
MANHKDTARPPTGEDLARDLWDLGVALNKAAAKGLGTPVDLHKVVLPKPILVEVEPDLTELRNLDTPDIFDSPEPDEDAPDEYGREDLTREEED